MPLPTPLVGTRPPLGLITGGGVAKDCTFLANTITVQQYRQKRQHQDQQHQW